MRRRVGVVKRNTIEVDVVIAIGKSAEVGLALAQTNSVAVQGKRPWRHRDSFTVIGHRRSEILDKSRTDISARRGGVQRCVHRSKRGGDRPQGLLEP